MVTGYYANTTNFTKTHIVFDGKPICGASIGKKLKFQWCANGVRRDYVECKNCLRCLDAYLKNRSK